ncbi:MAG: malonyl-ACP O-methyltransferase BioC [Gammaproteobacteria bacterium]
MMEQGYGSTPDKRRLAANFSDAAAGYDAVAILQKEVADALLERLDIMNVRPHWILDLGSGTGGAARQLARRYSGCRVLQLDLARNMLLQARKQSRRWFSRQSFVCAEAAALPVQAGALDLVYSSLMLQWCEDLDAVLSEIRRGMRGGGLFLFSSLGPDTLHELRDSWAEADDDGFMHVNGFRDMHEVGDALIRAGFADPVMEVDHMILTYSRVRDLMRELKQLGARNVSTGRRRALTGKRRLQTMMEAYEKYRREGRIPATYEVVYGHAWVPEGRPLPRPQDGVVTIPVESIGRRG